MNKTNSQINELKRAEIKDLFSDAIEHAIDNADEVRVVKLRANYKERFGVEFEAAKSFKPVPRLDQVFSQSDFPKYEDYMCYQDKLYELRFNTYKIHLKDRNPTIAWSDLVELLALFEVKAVIGHPRGTETAWVVDKSQIIFTVGYENNPLCSLSTVIHELGHILDNRMNNESARNYLFLHNNKATNYDQNPAEIFADSFMIFFVRV